MRRGDPWLSMRALQSCRDKAGAAMSVAMTNCGEAAWLSDRGGYRYDRIDPETGRAMAGMPLYFSPLATTNSSVKMALPPVIEPRHSDGAYPILLGLLSGPAANAAHW
jgi:alkylated DNA repair dioxygenase AlkB